MVGDEEKNRLLKRYWTVPDRQIETSVVLADAHAQSVGILLKGVAGTAMPAWSQLSDTEIAAVLTYAKNSWSNKTGQIVQPADVVAARK